LDDTGVTAGVPFLRLTVVDSGPGLDGDEARCWGKEEGRQEPEKWSLRSASDNIRYDSEGSKLKFQVFRNIQ